MRRALKPLDPQARSLLHHRTLLRIEPHPLLRLLRLFAAIPNQLSRDKAQNAQIVRRALEPLHLQTRIAPSPPHPSPDRTPPSPAPLAPLRGHPNPFSRDKAQNAQIVRRAPGPLHPQARIAPPPPHPSPDRTPPSPAPLAPLRGHPNPFSRDRAQKPQREWWALGPIRLRPRKFLRMRRSVPRITLARTLRRFAETPPRGWSQAEGAVTLSLRRHRRQPNRPAQPAINIAP